MNINNIKILIITFTAIILSLFLSDVLHLSYLTLTIYFIIFVLDYIKNKKINLIHIWCSAFIYVIISEVLIDHDQLNSSHHGLKTVKHLILSSYFLIAGYFLKKQTATYRNTVNAKNNYKKIPVILIGFIVLLSLFFILSKFNEAFTTINYGRAASHEESIISPLITALGIVIPTLCIYLINTYRNNIFEIIILYTAFSIVIIIIYFLGTRFFLLFTITPPLVIYLHKKTKIKIKDIIIAIIIIVSLGFASNAMRENRISGVGNNEYNIIAENDIHNRIGALMSPEGVVKNYQTLINYYEFHNHELGKSSLFLTYFWIPRSLWPDKPEMIGYWLIRYFESNISSIHSVSLGFNGELYSDFGYFSYFFLILIGLTLSILNKKISSIINNIKTSKNLFFLFFYPATFFFVRSPFTTTINLTFIYFIVFVFSKVEGKFKK